MPVIRITHNCHIKTGLSTLQNLLARQLIIVNWLVNSLLVVRRHLPNNTQTHFSLWCRTALSSAKPQTSSRILKQEPHNTLERDAEFWSWNAFWNEHAKFWRRISRFRFRRAFGVRPIRRIDGPIVYLIWTITIYSVCFTVFVIFIFICR